MRFLTPIFILLSFCSIAQFSSIFQSVENSFYFIEINDNSTVSIAGGIRFAKSLDEGYTWSEHSLNGYGMPFSLYTYHSAEIINDTTYLLVGNDTHNHKSIVIRTTDGGVTWSEVIASSNNSYRYSNDISRFGSVVMVATSNGVWRSTNSGQNFTFIPIVAYNSSLNATTIKYIPDSDKWLWKYEDGTVFETTDNGMTWNAVLIASGGLLNDKINTSTLSIIGVNKTVSPTDSCSLYLLNEQGTLFQQISFPYQLVESGEFKEAHRLSDSLYILNDGAYFYLVNTSDSTIERFTHTLLTPTTNSPSEIYDFEMGNTFGLAVGYEGAISRFDLMAPFDTRVYANFVAPTNPCSGESIYFQQLNTNVDSVKWYIQDEFVSDQIDFNWTVPSSSGIQEVKLVIWKNHISDSMQIPVFPIVPLPRNIYNLTSTLTPCYGVIPQMKFSYQTGAHNISNSYVLSIFRGDTVYYSTPAPSHNFIYNLAPVYTTDTIFLYVARPYQCGMAIDTFKYIIDPVVDLTTQFNYSSEDSVLCTGTGTIDLNFTDLVSNLTYKITDDITSWNQTFSGIQDTITVTSNNNYYYQPVFSQNGQYWIDFYMTVTSSNGCSSGPILLDSFHLIDPTANFEINPEAYLVNDTLALTNLQYAYYNEWLVSDSSVTLENTTLIVPTVSSSLEGIYDLTLVNEPTLGCTNSMTKPFYFGESSQLLSEPLCNQVSLIESKSIVGIYYDNEGNTIELSTRGINGNSVDAGRTKFNIAKRDSNGDLLWIKSPDIGLGIYNRLAIIDQIKIDGDNNIYAILRWNLQSTFNYEMITYSSPVQKRRAYIIKLDGETGNMIAYYDVQQAIKDAVYTSSNFEIYNLTDIELTSQGIYFSADLGVGLMGYDGVVKGFHRASTPYPIKFHHGTLTSSGADASLTTPELEVLSNGELVVFFAFMNHLNISGQMINVGTGNNGIVAAKYSHLNGFSNQTLISQGHQLQNDMKGKTFLKRSQNDLLTIAFHTVDKRTIIRTVDSDFNTVWQKELTKIEIGDMAYAAQSNQLYLSAYATNTVGLIGETNSIVIGEKSEEWKDGQSLLIAKFDENGELLTGRLWYIDTNGTSTPFHFLTPPQSRIAVNPCGQVAWQIKPNFLPISLHSYGEIIYIDQPTILYLNTDCATSDTCIYSSATAIDTLWVCEGTDLQVMLPIVTYGDNTITYHLIDSNGIQPSVSTTSNWIQLSPEVTEIVVESPINQVYSVMIDNGNDIEITYDSILCNSGVISFAATPYNYAYYWITSSNSFTSSNPYPLHVYSGHPLGEYEQVVKIVTQQCIFYDTVQYKIGQGIDPNFEDIYNVECNDSLQMYYTEGNYSDAQWILNGQEMEGNVYSSEHLNNGTNYLNVTLISDLGCPWNESILINYCLNPEPEEPEPEPGVSIEAIENSKIQIGPNPNNGQFSIVSDVLLQTINMYSMDGKLVFQTGINAREHTLDLELSDGYYLMMIYTADNTYHFKIEIRQ